jgi:hypothetical protein
MDSFVIGRDGDAIPRRQRNAYAEKRHDILAGERHCSIDLAHVADGYRTHDAPPRPAGN